MNRFFDINIYLEQAHYVLVKWPASYRLPDSLQSPLLFLSQLPLKETASVWVMGTYSRGSCEKELRSEDLLYLRLSPVVFQIPPTSVAVYVPKVGHVSAHKVQQVPIIPSVVYVMNCTQDISYLRGREKTVSWNSGIFHMGICGPA